LGSACSNCVMSDGTRSDDDGARLPWPDGPNVRVIHSTRSFHSISRIKQFLPSEPHFQANHSASSRNQLRGFRFERQIARARIALKSGRHALNSNPHTLPPPPKSPLRCRLFEEGVVGGRFLPTQSMVL
jgi:hypothetical protein